MPVSPKNQNLFLGSCPSGKITGAGHPYNLETSPAVPPKINLAKDISTEERLFNGMIIARLFERFQHFSVKRAFPED
ncbi:MAG: hypothetical protein AAB210_02985 [Deltaproteobacteria bacterium]